MQSCEAMLSMLGLSKYASTFKSEGFTDIPSVAANIELASGLLSKGRERDILRGYLSVRKARSEESDVAERREAIIQNIKRTLGHLEALHARKEAAIRCDCPQQEAQNILEAIDDAKENLRVGKSHLESLANESRNMAKGKALPKSESLRGERSPRLANEMPTSSKNTAGTRCIQTRPDPQRAPRALTAEQTEIAKRPGWNQGTRTTRTERASRVSEMAHLTRSSNNELYGLCVMGSKATNNTPQYKT